MTLKSRIVKLARRFGYDIRHYPDRGVDERDRKILNAIAGFTMTELERQVALIDAVRYLTKAPIEGAFVECGVWRGGSSMAMAHTLLQEGVRDRRLYLYDTFEGMTPPTSADVTFFGAAASDLYGHFRKKDGEWNLRESRRR